MVWSGKRGIGSFWSMFLDKCLSSRMSLGAVVMRNVFDQGWWQQRWLHVSAHTAVGKCWKAILLHLTKGRKLVSIWHLQAEEKLWKLLTTTLQTASPIIMSFKKKHGSLASNKIWESSKRKYCEVKSGCLHFGRQRSTNFLAWIKVVSPGDVICFQPSQRCRCQHPHPARRKDRLMFHEPLTTAWLSHVKKSVQLASPKYDQGNCYAKCVWPGMMRTTLAARLCPHCSWKMLKSDFAAPDQRTKTRQHLTPASRRKIVETPNYNPSNCITDHHEL